MIMRATCRHEVCDTCFQEEGSLQLPLIFDLSSKQEWLDKTMYDD